MYAIELDEKNLSQLAITHKSELPVMHIIETSELLSDVDRMYLQLNISKTNAKIPTPRNYAILLKMYEDGGDGSPIFVRTVTSSLKVSYPAVQGKRYRVTLEAPGSRKADIVIVGKRVEIWTPKLTLFIGPHKNSRQVDEAIG